MLVNRVQSGNAVLKCVKRVAWRYAKIEADFSIGQATARPAPPARSDHDQH